MEEENDRKKAFAVLGLALASLIVLPNAHASETDQATRLTFSESVQVPGRVLPAGTYWFVADRNTSNPKVVRVFSEDRSTCYATLQTISAEHLAPADETVITFADRASMQPEAIVTWFYPGRTIGQEFVYSKKDRKEIEQAKQYTVAARKEFVQVRQHTVPPGN